MKKPDYRIYKSKVIVSIVFYAISFIIANIWIFCYGDDFITGNFGMRDLLFFVSAAVMIVSMAIYLTILIKLIYKLVIKKIDKKGKTITIGMFALFVLSYAPFVVVGPSGYRCSFLMTFIMTCLFILLFKQLKTEYDVSIDVPVNLISCITCAIGNFYGFNRAFTIF